MRPNFAFFDHQMKVKVAEIFQPLSGTFTTGLMSEAILRPKSRPKLRSEVLFTTLHYTAHRWPCYRYR